METLLRQQEALLARPFKHKISQKYVPDDEIKWKNYKRPIMPVRNKRIHMLAVPVRVRPKYEPVEVPSTIINRAVLEATCTPRLNHLSRPLVRYIAQLLRIITYCWNDIKTNLIPCLVEC